MKTNYSNQEILNMREVCGVEYGEDPFVVFIATCEKCREPIHIVDFTSSGQRPYHIYCLPKRLSMTDIRDALNEDKEIVIDNAIDEFLVNELRNLLPDIYKDKLKIKNTYRNL